MIENVTKHKLSNGLHLLLIPSRKAPVVALQGWVKYGAADETDEIAGVAHLFEHLLFKGTENRAVGQIAKEIEGMGGDLNAYTTYDHTVMHMTLASKYLEHGLDILADSLLYSVVEESELNNERPVILEEIKRRNDMPGAVAGDLFREQLFRGHPYSRPVIGYDHVVSGISRDRIMKEYHSHYTTENLFITICGDFDQKKAIAACEKLFAKTPKGGKRRERAALENLPKNLSHFKNHETPDALAHLGWRVPGTMGSEVAALDAFALILGQGESSRLHRSLVHDHKLVRGIGSSVWSPRDTGSFSIGFKCTDELSKKMPDIESAIYECLVENVTPRELEKAKKNLLSNAIYSRETVDGLAERFAYCESIADTWEADGAYLEAVRSLNTNDLHKARDQFLDWDKALGAGLVPKKESLPEFKSRRPSSKTKPITKTNFKKGTDNVQELNFKGLKVLLRPSNELPMFSIRWVGWGGQRLENSKQSGIGALWARTVCDGVTLHDGQVLHREALNEVIDAASASLSSFHGRNSFGFQLDGLTEDLDILFSLLAASLNAPLFEDKVIKQEIHHQTQDIQTQKQNPGSLVSKAFNELMFPKHAYGRSSLGDAKTVKAFKAADLKKYHQRLVDQPQVLSVCGDISADKLEALLKLNFANKTFPKQNKPNKAALPSYPKVKKEIFQKLNKEQMHLLWGFPTCNLYHKDRWALLALSAILSGQGGRLFVELRDKLSLCYTVSPTHMEGIDGGYFAFYIGTSPDKTDVALQGMRRELMKIINEGVSDEEWNKAHTYITGNHQLSQQSLGAQSMGMALDELYGMGYSEYFNFDDVLSKITSHDIKKVAQKYLHPDKNKGQVLSLVGPSKPKIKS